MRFYPDSSVDFYWEFPSYERCCHEPDIKWDAYRQRFARVGNAHYLNYWRDLEGAKMKHVTLKDLYIKDWYPVRLRYGACLPLLYASGYRFIKLEKAWPVGFKCAPIPVNLKEAREIKAQIAKEKKAARAAKKAAKKAAKAAKKKGGKK